MIVYMLLGAFLAMFALMSDAGQEKLRKQYIDYRMEAIAAGDSYNNEKTFRLIVIGTILIGMAIAWPIVIAYQLLKTPSK